MSRKVFVADEVLDASDVNDLIMTPSGVISAFAGATAPTGYLLCDGSSVSTTTYNQLFAILGYTYGGSGATFALPNLKGRIPVGRDATIGSFDTVGETGGERTVTLTTDEMPVHTHTQNAHNHTQDPHSHLLGLNVAADQTSFGDRAVALSSPSFGTNHTISSATATNQATTATNQNAGGGQAHNNLQPYLVVNYIIKT
jgi:microcystin-dependent protein